jgi:predicted flap endonuclease-1-like 5' DNA nuclease
LPSPAPCRSPSAGSIRFPRRRGARPARIGSAAARAPSRGPRASRRGRSSCRSRVVQEREPAPAQDLKRIRLIDAELEASLNKLGVRRYEQIAAWMQPDVKRIGDALGLEGRINQENWIEQAQVLAKGGETYFATRRARGEAASAAPTPDEGERRSVVGVATVARTVAVTGPTFDSPPEVSDRAAFAAQAAAATLVASPLAPTAPGPAVPMRRRHRQRATICCASAASMPRSRAC